MAAPRRGVAMIVAMICLFSIAMLGATLLRLAVVQYRQTRQDQRRLQAEWLAESGLQRAVARLRAEANWSGDVWDVSAESLGAPGVVTTRIVEEADAADASGRRIVVTAEFPAGSQERARCSRSARVELPAKLPQESM